MSGLVRSVENADLIPLKRLMLSRLVFVIVLLDADPNDLRFESEATEARPDISQPASGQEWIARW